MISTNAMEEKATGLAYDIALCWCKEQHQQCDKAEEIIPLISAALAQARAEALEEAAKVANQFQGNWTNPPYDWYATKSWILKKIRALATATETEEKFKSENTKEK